MKRSALFLAVFGCASVSTPLANRPEHTKGAFLAEWVPDYEQPFADAAPDLNEIACRRGERSACWKIIDERARVDAVAENCASGHVLSCRALEDGSGGMGPGLHGRYSLTCRFMDFAACDSEIMAQECVEGFPRSCRVVAFLFRTLRMQALEDLVIARALRLFREGCRLGIAVECLALISTRERADLDLAWEQMCRSAPENCDRSGEQMMHEPVKALRAFEYGCQVGRSPYACLAAARGYQSGTFVEPVPGRAERLQSWVEAHTP